MGSSYVHRMVGTLFGRYLYITNTVSCSGLLAVGDAVQQRIEIHYGRKKTYDWTRTGRMITVGLVLGPMTHMWYTWLDRRIPTRTAASVFKKILYDQFCASPMFSFTFINGMSLLEGHDLKTSLMEFKQKFPLIYLMDWLVWPPGQTINFFFVPNRFRAMFVYFIDVTWYTFCSYMKHHDRLPQQTEADQVTDFEVSLF